MCLVAGLGPRLAPRGFFNRLDPFREALRRNYSEVRAVASRNGLYQILAINVALGVWLGLKCGSPRPDWYRDGGMRGRLLPRTSENFFSTTLVNRDKKQG